MTARYLWATTPPGYVSELCQDGRATVSLVKAEIVEMDSIESTTLITRPDSGSLLPSAGPCREVRRDWLGAMVRETLGEQRQEECRPRDGPRMAATRMSGDLQGASPPSHRSNEHDDDHDVRVVFYNVKRTMKRRFPFLVLLTERCAPGLRVGRMVHEIVTTGTG